MNKGLEYERKIKELLVNRKVLPPHLYGRLTETGNDAGFIHQGKDFFLEIKNNTAPDYGAQKIIYDAATERWKWNDFNEMTELFDEIGVLKQIPAFKPRKHVKADHELTDPDKVFDRRSFAKMIPLPGTSGAILIHRYYAKKGCYYIQVEGKGFYHLLDDRADLRVPKFLPEVAIRLRAKTHSSKPISNYSFRAVIVAKRQTIFPSERDIESELRFPPIMPAV